MLKTRGIKHEVLNAKYHEKEAQIVAQAGKLGAVTIATNMAGRGTDIMLGGNAEYLAKARNAQAGLCRRSCIAEATGYAETDNEEILDARQTFQELNKKYKEEITVGGGAGPGSRAACSSSAPSATSPAGSTTSCAAVPAGRATRARAGSTSPWRTT